MLPWQLLQLCQHLPAVLICITMINEAEIIIKTKTNKTNISLIDTVLCLPPEYQQFFLLWPDLLLEMSSHLQSCAIHY